MQQTEKKKLAGKEGSPWLHCWDLSCVFLGAETEFEQWPGWL